MTSSKTASDVLKEVIGRLGWELKRESTREGILFEILRAALQGCHGFQLSRAPTA
jgi:hypothetical protein